MFSKFSEEAQKVLLDAKKEMKLLKHSYVGSEHLLLSLLKNCDNISAKFMEYDLSYKKVKNKLIEIVGYGNDDNDWFIYTPLLKKILESAMYISKDSNNSCVSCEILLFSILEENEGIAIKILKSFNIDLFEIQDYFSSFIMNKNSKDNKKLLVEEYGIDLCEKAKLNQLDPVIGRDDEINRIIQILCRRYKNNPLLIGEAGVGKTAIVEELARLIVLGKVPNKLKNKRIISISIASLVAGTKYRGEFEEKVTNILSELEKDDSIILFIDEIHTLMGAGGAEGAIDAANIFKPVLARGNIKLIGATTTLEYKQTILKDKAIERRFQTVNVFEPDNDKVYDILSKIKTLYEDFHNVEIDNKIIKEIINLTSKYIFDRRQPDKSIDVLDEVCSKVALADNFINKSLEKYNKELIDILDKKNNCIINHDFDSASKLRLKEKELYSNINKIELKMLKNRKRRRVTINDVVDVINMKTNIPIFEYSNINKKYIVDLENFLKKKILGQDEAIIKLINYSKRKMLGLNNKPYSFLFLGSSGVGKSYLANIYGNFVYKNNIVRLNMSDYRDSSSISKLLGSNPGYVGYNDYKNVFEVVKNNPHTIFILEEIEKADSSILDLFIEILNNGKITDSKCDEYNFSQCLFIFISKIDNKSDTLGFSNIINNSSINNYFPNSFLSSINDIIYFKTLKERDIKKLIKEKLDEIVLKFNEKNISICFSNKTINKILNMCEYDKYGANKIDKVLEMEVDSIIIDCMINGIININLDSLCCK